MSLTSDAFYKVQSHKLYAQYKAVVAPSLELWWRRRLALNFRRPALGFRACRPAIMLVCDSRGGGPHPCAMRKLVSAHKVDSSLLVMGMVSPAGMFGGKAPLRLAAQKSRLHAP